MESPSLWRNRDYLRFRTALLVSELGSKLTYIAYPLLVLHLTGNLAETGLIATCGLIAATASLLPAGYLADRIGRRSLMVAMDLARLLVVGTVPLSSILGHLYYPQFIVVAVIEGAASAAFEAASPALLRDLVPASRLGGALGQSKALIASVSLIGPALGGAIYSVQPLLPFVLDGCSYGLSAVLLLAVTAPPPAPARTADRRMTAGLRWLRTQPGVLRMLAFGSALNLAAAATMTAVVLELRERGTAPEVIGIVLACASIGTLAGAGLSGRITLWVGPPGLSLAIGLVWASGLAALAVASPAWAAGPVLAMLFLLSPAASIMLANMTLNVAPRHLHGRVMTTQVLISTGLAAAGPALAGAGLGTLGAPGMWLALAAVCLLTTLIVVSPLVLAKRAQSQQAKAEAVSVGGWRETPKGGAFRWLRVTARWQAAARPWPRWHGRRDGP